jgi:hypothetical protein
MAGKKPKEITVIVPLGRPGPGSFGEITASDIGSFDYFFNEKGTITCWSQWDTEKKFLFFAAHPELKFAMEQRDAAERNLKAVVRNIIDSYEEVF